MPSERILVLNGPNLNLLGRREPAVYGSATLAEVGAKLERLADELNCTVELRHSNSEGTLVDWLAEAWDAADGVILNAGALTHYSYALRDAVAAIEPPVIELHISNVHAREEFRATSVIAPVAAGIIAGFGIEGYELALRGLLLRLRSETRD
jgi:3-dehydroquinate dehydratase-2